MIQGSGVRVWLLIVLVPGFGCGVWLLSGCSQASRPGAPGACVASDCAGTCSFRVDGAVRAGQVGAGAAVSLACRESLVARWPAGMTLAGFWLRAVRSLRAWSLPLRR